MTIIRIRSYQPVDREFVLSLAPRLVLGIQPWRDPRKMEASAFCSSTFSPPEPSSLALDN